MKLFLSALIRHWMSKFLFLLALGSTVATYIPSFVHNISIPRWLPLVFLIAAWFMGSYDVYRSQDSEIRRLRSENQALIDKRNSVSLFLQTHDRSCFFRHAPDGKTAVGTYLHINATVENKGGHSAVISTYQLAIKETGTDTTLRPRGFSYIQGLSHAWGIDTTKKNLALDGYIRIPAYGLAGPDILPFYINEVPTPDCRVLHCTVTLVTTNGEETSSSFVLPEQGIT